MANLICIDLTCSQLIWRDQAIKRELDEITLSIFHPVSIYLYTLFISISFLYLSLYPDSHDVTTVTSFGINSIWRFRFSVHCQSLNSSEYLAENASNCSLVIVCCPSVRANSIYLHLEKKICKVRPPLFSSTSVIFTFVFWHILTTFSSTCLH